MAVVEAIEFNQELKERTALSPSLVFLNRMQREGLSAAAQRALTEVDAAPGSFDQVLLECAGRVQRRTRLDAFHYRRLAKGLDLTPIVVGELSNCRPATVLAELRGEAE
jgi:hypothetical protein